MKPIRRSAAAAAALCLTAGTPALAQQIEVEEFTLDNGMTFLLLPREEQPLNVAAGWVARVGSVNEPVGMSGLSHFLEHMMFKGTDAIGTTDSDADAQFRTRLADLRQQLFALTYDVQYDRFKAGEIDDPWDPTNDTPEIRAIRAEMTKLQDEQKTVTINNDFDRVYTAEGASGMNAQTFYDWTRYFITVPSNKLELWAWLESDRLFNPSFREFDAEKDVVIEERRQVISNTPTGELDEQFYSMMWMASPYNWPVIGWPSDIQGYTQAGMREYFETYYQPRNLVGVIVGDFDPEEAKQLVTSYFGRLEDPGMPIPEVTTIEMQRQGELLFMGECDCQPQAALGYQGVPFGHEDHPTLDVIADLLNGRTGRFYKSLIEDAGIASSVSASNYALKYAGAFFIDAQVKGDTTPDELDAAVRAELQRLIDEPVPARELQKVKNNTRADAVRGMQNNMGLLQQLLFVEAYTSWEDINAYPELIDAVTPEDIQRVAQQYFSSGVAAAHYTRREGSESAELTIEDALAGVPEPMQAQLRGQVEMQLEQIRAAEDIDELRTGLEQAGQMKEQVPPMMHPMIDFMVQETEKRIAELESAGGEG